jgi:hypothetical protein
VPRNGGFRRIDSASRLGSPPIIVIIIITVIIIGAAAVFIIGL